jgi:hypothetical protein
VELSEPEVRLSRPQVALPGAVEAALGQRVRSLGMRAAALRNPPPLRVLENPGFERPPTATEALPGWAVSKRPGVAIVADKSQAHAGSQSAKVSSEGQIACLVSQPFAAPTTGRLSMSVWLRVADAQRQPPLRLAMEGRLNGETYYRYAPLGATLQPVQPVKPIAATWARYVFQVNDLPLDGLSQVRLRFDLMSKGELWIDDVQLYDLAFSEKECVELSKLVALAYVKLQSGQLGDCVRLLEGYWPRFLETYVPLSPDLMPPDTIAGSADSPAPTGDPPPERSGLLDRVRSLLPQRLRF